MKALLILCALLALLMYGLIVATSAPSDKETYDAYEAWKERKRNETD